MSVLYPHCATLWLKGQEAGGEATWERMGLIWARIESLSGTERLLAGEELIDAYWVYLPDTPGLAALKSGDRILRGLVDEDKPPKDAHRIRSVEAVRVREGVHHWEVLAT